MRDEHKLLSEAEVQTPAVQEPQPASADDPAAVAFEELRREVALARRAVAGLAAERAAAIPVDYSETLAAILDACKGTSQWMGSLAKQPALQLTPETMAKHIAQAGETARRGDQIAWAEARANLQETATQLAGHLRAARNAKRQRFWLAGIGLVGLIAGAILGGMIVHHTTSPAVDHRSPEARAAAILGLDPVAAGAHLIRSAAPQYWQEIVLGADIVAGNRDSLRKCQREMAKGRTRCVITLPRKMQ